MRAEDHTMHSPLRTTVQTTITALLALSAAAWSLQTQAGEVIAHPSTDIAAGDVRDIFVGDKQLAGGTKLVPVDNAAAQAEFLSKVLQMESPRYVSNWTKKSFREGLTAPASKGSDAEVIAFVKADRKSVV